MIEVPKRIRQLNIHEFTIVRVDTCLRTENEEHQLYVPLMQVSFIEEGKESTKMRPFETIRTDMFVLPEFYYSLDDLFLALRRSIDQLLRRGVIVSLNPVYSSTEILYTPGHTEGRIYDAEDITEIFQRASNGIVTFQDLWADNYREYIVGFSTWDDVILEYRWMEERDDLWNWIKSVTIDSHVSLFDIQDIRGGGPTAAPVSIKNKVRIPVDSYFVISCMNESTSYKTYFASFINQLFDKDKICVNYTSTISGAHHFTDEQKAMDFALKYSDSLMNGIFEVEEIKEKTLVTEKSWMKRT